MKRTILLLSLILSTSFILAQSDSFTKGPQIKEFGENALIKSDVEISEDLIFKVAFDVAKQGEANSPNRYFNSLARFINMHVRSGIKPENIQLALVVHGKASNDVMNNSAYAQKFESDNPNHALLNELLNNNVDIYLCGQSATYYEIDNKDLHSGVKMSLSAMTAHALLQQQGYTLNPF